MRDNDIHSKLSLNGRHSRRLSRRRAPEVSWARAWQPRWPAPWRCAMPRPINLMGPGGILLARPDQPVTLPRFEDLRSRAGWSRRRAAPSRSSTTSDYIDKKVVDEFGKKYKVKTQITTFDSMDIAITRLAKHVKADVTNIFARPARPGRRRQAAEAGQPRLCPQPEEERLADAAEPVLRRRVALHRAPTPSTAPASAGAATR